MRKVRTIIVNATNFVERVSGLDLVDEVATQKLANARVHHLTDDTAIMSVDSIDATFATDTDTVAELICTPSELIYVADSDRVENLFRYINTGKSGLCAEDMSSDGYKRGFWSAPMDAQLCRKVIAFLKGEKLPEDEPVAPNCADVESSDGVRCSDVEPSSDGDRDSDESVPSSLEELYRATRPRRRRSTYNK